MASEIGAPKQHKQPSRKGKKAWRKNVDITEVQDGLTALREEIIQTGSGPISEQKSEDLFAVDVLGSEDIKRKIRHIKPLKVDEILAKRSAIPAVDSRKRASSRTIDGILEPASKRQKKEWVSQKDVRRLKQIASSTSHLTAGKFGDGEHDAGFDLWAGEGSSSIAKASSNAVQELEYVPKVKVRVAPATIRRAPIAMTASGRPVKSIQNPDAGTSYNPDFEQWDELLNREGAKAVQAEQQRLQKEQEQAERQARVDAHSQEDANYRTDDESAWEGFETEREGDDDANMLKQKRPQRKTPAQRNKIKRRKEAERLAKHEKKLGADKGQSIDTKTDSTLVKIPDPNDKALGTLSTEEQSDSDEDGTSLRRRRLGPSTISTQDLELVLPDELQESLRQLKPEGNLLSDRFRSLLVNGKIESRKPIVAPKKKKVKMTEKWSYKDFRIQV